jgi:hypothetical protein
MMLEALAQETIASRASWIEEVGSTHLYANLGGPRNQTGFHLQPSRSTFSLTDEFGCSLRSNIYRAQRRVV